MDIKQRLGKRIQSFRKFKKLTQEQLAEIIGIDVVSLSKIETGRNYPASENLEKIARALDVLPYELFVFKKEEKDNKELVSKIKKNITFIRNDHKKLSLINNIIEEIITNC